MNLKEAMDRIEQLERRVRELEMRPPITIQTPNIGYPQYPQYPQNPYFAPWQPPMPVWCGNVGASIGGGSSN